MLSLPRYGLKREREQNLKEKSRKKTDHSPEPVLAGTGGQRKRSSLPRKPKGVGGKEIGRMKRTAPEDLVFLRVWRGKNES